MCTNSIKAFEPIIYKDELIFTSSPIIVPYIGPTLTIKGKSNKTILKTKDNYTFDAKGQISLKLLSDLCVVDNGPITTYGNIEIDFLQIGPFSTIDTNLELNFRQLFFNFEKLVVPVNIEIYASKDLVCKEEDKEKRLDEIEVHITLATEKKILFDNYFVTNSNNVNNINFLYYDLRSSFTVYQSIYGKFGVFYEKLLSGLLASPFGTIIKNKFIDIVCTSPSISFSARNPSLLDQSLPEPIDASTKNIKLDSKAKLDINNVAGLLIQSDMYVPIIIGLFIIFIFIIKYFKLSYATIT